jgi:hypothetical protein
MHTCQYLNEYIYDFFKMSVSMSVLASSGRDGCCARLGQEPSPEYCSNLSGSMSVLASSGRDGCCAKLGQEPSPEYCSNLSGSMSVLASSGRDGCCARLGRSPALSSSLYQTDVGFAQPAQYT